MPTIDRHGPVTLCPFALLSARDQGEVARFRLKEAKFYPQAAPPWEREKDTVAAWDWSGYHAVPRRASQ